MLYFRKAATPLFGIRTGQFGEDDGKNSGLVCPGASRDNGHFRLKEPRVSKSSEQPKDEVAIPAQTTSETPAAQAPRQQLQVDDSKVMALYANFCRVTGTPEELILDFGLNPQPFGIPTEPIAVTQRIITNFFTAKRMLAALQMTIQRHEGMFGVLETDVQKRVKTQR
jgi:hypothetical protein